MKDIEIVERLLRKAMSRNWDHVYRKLKYIHENFDQHSGEVDRKQSEYLETFSDDELQKITVQILKNTGATEEEITELFSLDRSFLKKYILDWFYNQ